VNVRIFFQFWSNMTEVCRHSSVSWDSAYIFSYIELPACLDTDHSLLTRRKHCGNTFVCLEGRCHCLRNSIKWHWIQQQHIYRKYLFIRPPSCMLLFQNFGKNCCEIWSTLNGFDGNQCWLYIWIINAISHGSQIVL
jgi:hypothetical protein